MSKKTGLEERAEELRRTFDLSFASPPSEVSQDFEDLLGIRVVGDPYAIRLSDIAGVLPKGAIVSVPSMAPGLLGLAGIRGSIVPVFGLPFLLGYENATEPPSWMVLCGVEEPVALGFSEFEGCLRLPKTSLHAEKNLRSVPQHVHEIATTDAGLRPVIGIPLVVATIRNRLGHERPNKEQ